MTIPEKAMLEKLAEENGVAQTVILRAGLYQFASKPEVQQVWVELATQEFKREIPDGEAL
jgi:hypothetical protein